MLTPESDFSLDPSSFKKNSTGIKLSDSQILICPLASNAYFNDIVIVKFLLHKGNKKYLFSMMKTT